MSNATTWGNEGLANKPEEKFASARRMARFLVFVLLFTLAASSLNLLQHTVVLEKMADRVETVARWVSIFGAVGALVGTVALLVLLSRFRAWQNEWTERVKDFEKLSAVSQQSLQSQFIVERQSKDQSEKRSKELAERNAVLEEELDKRKRSEKPSMINSANWRGPGTSWKSTSVSAPRRLKNSSIAMN